MDFTPNLNYSYGNKYIFGIPFNKSYQLLFRTTRTMNGVTEDVWANVQKGYANGEHLPRFIQLSDIEFGVMKPNKEIVFNTCDQDMNVPKKNYTHFIIRGEAISNSEFTALSTPEVDKRWTAFQLKHLRHNRSVQQSFPYIMDKLQNTVDESGSSLWTQLCNYTMKTVRDISYPSSCREVANSLSRTRYFNNFKIPRTAKTIQFETTRHEIPATRGKANVLGTPRMRGASTISPVFNYPIAHNRRYILSWSALRETSV